MKAVQFFRHGRASEVATLVEVPEPPPPGPGEVLVEVIAAPINPSDLLHFEGRYGVAPTLPSFAGGGVLARVVATGADVSRCKADDWVLVVNTRRSAWCERFVWPAARTVPVKGTDPLALALLVANPPTALLMLEMCSDLKEGDWVIQNAANSSVGISLVQIARSKGLRTVNVVRRDGLQPYLSEFGADVTIVDGPDLCQRVIEQIDRDSIKVAIDAVGGISTMSLAGCLSDGGVVINYGLLSGQPCAISPSDLIFRDISLRGFWYSRWISTSKPEEVQRLFARLAEMLHAGALRVPVEAAYPIERLGEALAHAELNRRLGKVVLTWNRT